MTLTDEVNQLKERVMALEKLLVEHGIVPVKKQHPQLKQATTHLGRTVYIEEDA